MPLEARINNTKIMNLLDLKRPEGPRLWHLRAIYEGDIPSGARALLRA